MAAAGQARIRVLLCEDHRIVREGLRALLEGCPDIEVAGEAADGSAAVESALRLRPDVVVMDLAMPGMGGVEAARQICGTPDPCDAGREGAPPCPAPRVLVLTMHAGPEYVRPAIRAGATGYLLKGSGLTDLVAAVRAVASGQAFFSPAVARTLAGEDGLGPDDPERLSTREREVLELVVQGLSSGEVAHRLGLSTRTVEGHRARIMARLGIRDIPGLVRWAIRAGLTSVE